MNPVAVTVPNASVPIGRTSVKKVPTKERDMAADVVLHAAGLMIVTSDRHALFLKRATDHDHAGEWCWPGGALENGELAETAAIRECREETGYIPDGKLKEVDHSVSPEGVDFTTYSLIVGNPFIAELDDEHVGWAWAPLDDPPQPLHPGCKATLGGIIDTDEVMTSITNDAKPANVATPAELRSVIEFPPPKASNGVREIDQSFERGGAGKELQQSTKARRFEARGGLSEKDKGPGPLGKDKEFSEADHPRGQPGNAGQFGSGGGGKSNKSETDKGEASKYKPGLHAAGLEPADKKKKEWAASSPIKTVDDLLSNAPKYQEDLSKVLGSVADKLGLPFKNPGVKSRERIERKVNIDGKPPNRINDAVRGGVSINTPQQGDDIVNELAKHFEIADEGWYVTPAGYFDRKVMVRFDSGQVGEVQIWHPDLLRAKEKEGGHKYYVESQNLPLDDPKRKDLEQRQLELYSKVTGSLAPEWKALLGKGGSANDENISVNSAFDSVRASIPTDALSTRIHSSSRQTHASPGVHKAGSPSHEQNLISSAVSGILESFARLQQYKGKSADFNCNDGSGIVKAKKAIRIHTVISGPSR